MTHVEMIIDYVVDGDDFQYSDNHGVLIRCKDCKYFDPLTEDFDYNFCDAWAGGTNENMFCGFAERRQDADSSGNMSGTQKALKCTETHSCDYQRTETHDLVSRQAAINALGDKPLAWTEGEYEFGLQNQWQSDVDALKELPSVQPQRMRGKGRWNVYYHGEENGKSIFSYSCNQCGYGAPYNFIGGVCEQKKWNFCPNCGADMRGTE